MGKLVVSEFITVDGVAEDPGGEAFERGGWAFQFDRGQDGDRFKLDEVRAAEALLLGRVTYEGFARAWPKMKDDVGFAEKMNSMPKYVASRSLQNPEWANTTVLDGDVVEAVGKLKEQAEGDLLVNGSMSLAQTLLEQGLVDEVRLMVFPVVLGAGKRLFGDTTKPRPLRQVENRPAGDTMIVIYRPA
jgi:dihydrofolate reductase